MADKHKILIVEDEAVVARDIEQTLTRLGFDVVGTAQFANEAVAKVAEHKPDLVLMDISLQGKRDGVEAAQIIDERTQTPIVFLTAHTDKATVARAQGISPAGYLVKPFNRERLRDTINKALGIEDAAVEQPVGKASILLIDDSNYSQAMSLSLLGKQFQVKIASTYPRAQQMLKDSKADMIIANIDQADAGRGESLRRLRREAKIDTPAVVVSEKFTPQDVQMLKGENVHAFVVLDDQLGTRLAEEVEKLIG
ncbi:MAG: response regulator [Gemmatimonadetes bacterium]|jgi:CheY-like chemotaxis protein|nr:response regulator [Gemmatimonadota bacterium]MBT6150017.1 response regulator [Gemmatimonadota bacterium]MBT7863289.1 response regulator [Gemmatimonadota bacterium]